MKIAICDDDKAVLEQLRGFIRQYAARRMLDYTILEFDQSERLLEAVRRNPDIRILFLDIYMSPLSGMDLAETLRAEGNDCAIIFVTISTDHYARSYEVNAEHYLVKPITYSRVETALNRCETLLVSAARYASFFSGGHEFQVPFRQIRFVEVFRNQTVIHADGELSIRCTLETVMNQLSDPRFIRTHRSFLLNMDYVAAKCGNDIMLSTGEKVPLSRNCEKNFEREYGRYLTTSMTGDHL
ncbi:LytR/AlgR family response regulator transcription factor [Enterocloster asparagiformis]|uniref:LytR/AlgR family response regulator transcription factor n=1 Tax=Enterocloster asparagiformis TaxID=333367 RepID=UPI000463240C|nr:LytTR family DNA-binding domain-containing protein [Enterocloster asparagiformis]